MIEVRIPIPFHEYLEVHQDLNATFDKHGIICVLSADTVIRTWAGLRFDEWFDQQKHFVDSYLGWGEVRKHESQKPMIAAISADLIDEIDQPYVVMIFQDEPCVESYYSEEEAQEARDLALMFKLAHGGT